MQWIKCQRNNVVNKEEGKQGNENYVQSDNIDCFFAIIFLFLGMRLRWSTPEKEVLRSSTERHSLEGSIPTLSECELILDKNKSILKNRNPQSVRSFIYTDIKKRNRQ